ncbi:carbohydrate sulfotransferase 11-like [Haliotis rubra]|uniref:carbohydrate sulfotransferase 11-like n=1 Tax=Haliotis rubra TaxID=36100 RepID=UPI001EE62381|nr:carbohydrate sulfotransferase 11-like [Haliotis rubra]
MRTSKLILSIAAMVSAIPCLLLYIYNPDPSPRSMDFTNKESTYPLPPAMKEQQRTRHELIAKHCQSDPSGTATSVVIDPRSMVSFCQSHKIASTFWLRVFHFLRYYNPGYNITRFNPFTVSKYDVHFSQRKLKLYNLNDDRNLIFKTTRFMFAREPYTRLWSLFLDKFVVLDKYFLKTFGAMILRRKGHHMKNPYDFCHKDYSNVSFQDFLDLIVHWDNETHGEMDDHFGTVMHHCSPCRFKPDFVGKLETFDPDSKYILQLLGLSDFVQVLEHADHVLEEMHMLIDYNYLLFERDFKSCFVHCVKKTLDAFQMNGYLTSSSVERLKSKLPLPKLIFTRDVTNEYRRSKTNI